MHSDDPKVNPQADLLHQLGYETRDIALTTIVRWIAFLFVFIAVTSVITLGLYWTFVHMAKLPGPDRPVASDRLPPEGMPIVQGYPVRDIHEFRQEELDKLNSAQWKDRDRGIVSIPVGHAMDIVLERGLPTRTTPGGIAPMGPAAADTTTYDNRKEESAGGQPIQESPAGQPEPTNGTRHHAP